MRVFQGVLPLKHGVVSLAKSMLATLEIDRYGSFGARGIDLKMCIIIYKTENIIWIHL